MLPAKASKEKARKRNETTKDKSDVRIKKFQKNDVQIKYYNEK